MSSRFFSLGRRYIILLLDGVPRVIESLKSPNNIILPVVPGIYFYSSVSCSYEPFFEVVILEQRKLL